MAGDREGQKSREVERFGLYLRHGIKVSDEAWERKFNPYHDPDDGRFTFAPGGGTLPPKQHSVGSAGMTARVRRQMAAAGPTWKGPVRPYPAREVAWQPMRSRYPSALSAKYESGDRGDPGAISSVPGDPGGRSYGSHQLASRSGMIDAFIASPEASRWAADFRGLKPVTPQFDAKWKQIATHDPAAFGAAQEDFVGRTNYDAVVQYVLRSTGLNLDRASEAVRQATYSTAIQHGKARDVLTDAIRQADR